MLIGAHVSPAGGLAKAIERGVERGCQAIQIFNQSPRMWRPTAYGDDDFAAFRQAMRPSPVKAVLIHAVYLLNCASEDREIRDKSRASLIQSLRVGRRDRRRRRRAASRARPSRATSAQAIKRAGKVIGEALSRDRALPAAPGGHRGRRRHARALLRGAGRAARRGRGRRAARGVPGLVPPAGLRAMTSAPPAGLGRDAGRVRRGSSASSGWARCTSTTPRRRWAQTATATPTSAPASSASRAARRSCPSRASRSCRCVLETQGPERQGPTREEVELCFTLRKRGQASRASAPRPARGKSAG